ncbi:MAG: 50S ribosomal protein L21 [Candidatus Sumerlaeia bacterium]|nr:50S ribosomal protein L21 [Candidatus Sumerlaeia bacterium]
MYAVIKQGGRQYKVTTGDVIQIDLIHSEAGSAVELANVYMLYDGSQLHIGKPTVAGAVVEAKVVREGRGRKIEIYKYKRRQGYTKRQGHRQEFTEVRVTAVKLNGTALVSAPAVEAEA